MRKTLNLYDSGLTDQAKTYILSGAADSLVLWAPSWSRLEPVQGQVDESYWPSLDVDVAWAQEHHLPTFIAVLSNEMPPWLTGPWDSSKIWLWRRFYVGRVLRRYPHSTVIVLNEPDYAGIPTKACATMLREAADEAHSCGHKQILGPAAATVSYSLQVLRHLRGWKPPVRVGFAFHDYIGVKAGQTWRCTALLTALRVARWRAGPRLWLTELGYIFPTWQDPGVAGPDSSTWHYTQPVAPHEAKQCKNVIKHYQWCKKSAKVEMWGQYELQDSLHGGWASGSRWFDGTAKTLYELWRKL